ncbi:MAG: YicC family protein [Bacteroidales bacterium]|nr:YicC family protein [Bacteroidales bacterium]
MIKSMTGYGKAEAILETGKITFEIRTLNSKNADINIKTPLLPKDKEIGIRQKIANSLQRGTIDFYATWEPNAADSGKKINADLMKGYYNEILSIRKELPGFFTPQDRENNELLCSILRIPDVIDTKKSDVITEENWPIVEKAIDKALEAVNAYREKEGKVLYEDVTSRVRNILSLYDEVETFEGERIGTVKAKLQKNLEELAQKVDPVRFEQEMIFYLEKLDINEEKVRLRQHCAYFMDTIDSEPYPGKKLGFIIQEMGREINTTGSKANHAGIQKCVVRMKDELEKMREQSMNIL